ncbi:hypothetical protein CN601_10895 [Bacillus sp. AFS017336]|nr:hypothetical protein CN601_10895 [Bacillus sp. AFS017336]
MQFDIEPSFTESSPYQDSYTYEYWKTKGANPNREYIYNLFPNIDYKRFAFADMLFSMTIPLDNTYLDGTGNHVSSTISFEEELSIEEENPHVTSVRTIQDSKFEPDYVLAIYLKTDWYKANEDERNVELQKINNLSKYLQVKHFPVLVRIFYESANQDHWKAIFIKEDGTIVNNNTLNSNSKSKK